MYKYIYVNRKGFTKKNYTTIYQKSIHIFIVMDPIYTNIASYIYYINYEKETLVLLTNFNSPLPPLPSPLFIWKILEISNNAAYIGSSGRILGGKILQIDVNWSVENSTI